MEVKSKENVLYSEGAEAVAQVARDMVDLSLIHISEPTRPY